MSEKNYICINGEFSRAELPVLFIRNRAFRYGDVLYESVHAFGTEPQFIGAHLERLTENMRLLAMDIPPMLSEIQVVRLIRQLLNKNRIFGGACVRLTVYRDSDEGFIPLERQVSFTMESERLMADRYELNDTGHSLEICSTITKSCSPLSRLRNASSLVYLLAGLERKQKGTDALVLLNDEGRLVETIDSNLFLVSGNSIFTPGINQGCIPGIMRKTVIELAGALGYRINDQSSLTPAALDEAEEVFTTNAVSGIRWVGAFRHRRYFRKAARELTARLNEKAFGNEH